MQAVWEMGKTALLTLGALAVLFLLTKGMGARQVSQMTVFDYVVGITIGSMAAELATGLEQPLRPLTALVVCGAAAAAISRLTSASIRLRTLVTGRPLVLLEDGVLYRENLKKAKLDLSEFLTYCRISGWFDLAQLHAAVLEHNGAISFLPREGHRPATPADLGRSPRQSQMQIPFVMDGRLLWENIRRAGKEERWVRRTLLRQGYRDEAGVLLALWDGAGGLTVYPMDPAADRQG